MSSSPRSYVCIGKDCRCDEGHKELLAALRGVGKVQRVKCQDLCEGPVAGVEVGGRVEWFEKIRRGRHRDAVVCLANGSITKVPAVLQDRWAHKRRGKVKQ